MDEPPRASLTTDSRDNARRRARFTYAKRRIERLVSTEPVFTPEEFAELADLLRAGADHGEG